MPAKMNDPTSGKWLPILRGDDAARAKLVVAEIARAFDEPSTSSQTLFDLSSAALLFGYLAAIDSDEEEIWLAKTIVIVDRITATLSDSQHSSALFGGLAGAGWVLHHISSLLSGDSVESIEGDPLEELDLALVDRMSHKDWIRDYDLVAGLVGIGIYFLERLPRASAIAGLNAVLDRLRESAESPETGKLTWLSAYERLPKHQKEQCPNGNYNLGVAHGVPGVMGLLSEMATRRIGTNSAQMWQQSVQWLQQVEQTIPGESHFPAWVTAEEASVCNKLAWCYGDLGVAGVLSAVARANGNSALKIWSEGIIENSLTWPADRQVTPDAALCHGAFGVAHIYNRVFQRSSHVAYRDAAISWYRRGLEFRRVGTGVAGFSALRPELEEPNQPDLTFLSGAAGIALSLLAATTALPPHWDRMLLLSGAADMTSV